MTATELKSDPGLSLRAVALLPQMAGLQQRSKGEPPDIQTVRDWAREGYRGIRLETFVREDGQVRATMAAVDEFVGRMKDRKRGRR